MRLPLARWDRPFWEPLPFAIRVTVSELAPGMRYRRAAREGRVYKCGTWDHVNGGEKQGRWIIERDMADMYRDSDDTE